MRRQICNGLVWALVLGVGYFGSAAVLPPPDPLLAPPPPAPPTVTENENGLPFFLGENVRIVRVIPHDPMGEGNLPGQDLGSLTAPRR